MKLIIKNNPENKTLNSELSNTTIDLKAIRIKRKANKIMHKDSQPSTRKRINTKARAKEIRIKNEELNQISILENSK